MTNCKRLIIGVTGASGIIYAKILLEKLQKTEVETHLVVSNAGHYTRELELKVFSKQDFLKLASVSYRINDIGASIASGSFKTLGMIIVPCSMNTLAHVALGLSNNLLTRAASVILKERRHLVIVPREMPLNTLHLEHMLKLTQLGAIVAPPMPAFYWQPQSLEEMIDETVVRLLSLFDIQLPEFKEWQS